MRNEESKNRIAALAGVVGLSAVMLIATASQSWGAGLLIAEGGFGGVLEIEEHSAVVTINNGIAVTEVTQVFRNTEDRQVEALYTFPVPKGASLANFSMWINGEEMVGEVLEKKRAREIYESYKQKRRDPGLLEQTDYKTFEMRVFPIGPNADQRVRIRYYQELDVDNDWVTYVYPLATSTRRGMAATTGRFALALHARSEVPIASMESPSHGPDFVVARHSSRYVQASLETQGGEVNRDFVLAYQLSRPQTGIDVIASRQAGEDGYVSVALTVGDELSEERTGMDYVFILDVSGSMAHDGKLGLSRNSIAAFIEALGERDRFEIITFNITPRTLFNTLRPVNEESKAAAATFLTSQAAKGGTNLRPALETAYRYGDPDRVTNVVVLSDGMTEQSDRTTLLEMIRTRPQNARVFCIGVGNEVNRPLLEQLAEDAGGLASFISRGDDFNRQASAFRRKLMHPVMTDLKIEFEGARIYDIEPIKLPNLYHGSPVRLYARYRKAGPATITIRGNIDGKESSKSKKVQLPEKDDDNPEIERVWAWRRVRRLLKEADRTGSRSAVTQEVVRLGEAYSIATEYTSFIVLENDAEYKRWAIARRNALRIDRDRKPREELMKQLEKMRDTAIARLGPEGAAPRLSSLDTSEDKVSAAPSRRTSAPGAQRSSSTKRSRGLDLPSGGGPVGPVGAAAVVALAAAELLRRRRARK